MLVKVIRKSENKTSTWSGGTTTQLYIYPENAMYNELNFKWRISTAKVEVDESIFTNLPDIDRKIMIIDGKTVLEHEGIYTKELNEFEVDSFSGDWTTRSYGKVTDFNLMTAKECIGELEYINVDANSIKEIQLKNNTIEYSNLADVLYCVNGDIKIEIESNIELSEGDILILIRGNSYDKNDLEITNKSRFTSHIIKSSIQF